jgi:hypothetical protein
MKKINWIIMTDPLKPPFKGGPVILHHMAKNFLDRGDRVIMNNPYHEGVEKLNSIFLKDKTNDLDDFVLLLTENDFRLREFNFKKVVRFLLYMPKHQRKFDENEFIVQYGKSFTIGSIYESSFSIEPLVSKLNFWQDMGLQRIDKDLILKKKGNFNQSNKIYEGIQIDGLLNSNYSYDELEHIIKKFFNNHKRFITFDNDTFHSIQAALCGAISIVIADGRLTEKQWRNSSKLRQFGIAYGDTEEQINFAIKTRHKLSEIHNDVVHNGEKDIEIFREMVLNRFY